MRIVRDQLGSYIYPVHRLDVATSGVLLFALDSSSAARIQAQFAARTITKRYFAIVRGWTSEEGKVDSPLDGAASETAFTRIATMELPAPSKRYATSRYSLAAVEPLTGRRHQIRRHLAHLRHPLVGDTIYGDGTHNRIFRERIPQSGLFLKAYSIQLAHPRSGEELVIRSRWNRAWLEAFDLFGMCPITPERVTRSSVSRLS